MPPKAIEQTGIDKILTNMMPKDLSEATKLAIINDTGLHSKNMAFDHNYKKLVETGESLDLTEDYSTFASYLMNCIDSLKSSLALK